MESHGSEIVLSDLPDEILVSIVWYLSVRQAHRLRLDRRLRAFVDRYVCLDDVMTGRHFMLVPKETETRLHFSRRSKDAEKRSWGPFLFSSVYVNSGYFFDGQKTGLQTTFGSGGSETRTRYLMGKEIGRSIVKTGRVIAVYKGKVELDESNVTFHMRDARWQWGVRTDDHGDTFYLSMLALAIFGVQVEWGMRFCFHCHLPPYYAFTIEPKGGNEVRCAFQLAGGYDVEVEGESCSASDKVDGNLWIEDSTNEKSCLQVSVSKDGKRLAFISLNKDRFAVGFEMDGWHETTYDRMAGDDRR